MNLEEIADLAWKKAQQAKDYTDILNVFSAHLYCYRAQQQAYELEHFWSKERNDLVYNHAMGRAAVIAMYGENEAERRAQTRKRASKVYPNVSDTPSYEGVGDMVAKAASSPYVVIAEDGMSAHGIWFVPGFCLALDENSKVTGFYYQEKNAVDFVKEADGWKILRLEVWMDFRTPCTHIDFTPEQYKFQYPLIGQAQYAEPYSATAVAKFCPPLPKPYDSWEHATEFLQTY